MGMMTTEDDFVQAGQELFDEIGVEKLIPLFASLVDEELLEICISGSKRDAEAADHIRSLLSMACDTARNRLRVDDDLPSRAQLLAAKIMQESGIECMDCDTVHPDDEECPR